MKNLLPLVPHFIKMCSYGHFRQLRQNFVKMSYVGRTIATIGVSQLIKTCSYGHFRQKFVKMSYVGRTTAIIGLKIALIRLKLSDHFSSWIKVEGPMVMNFYLRDHRCMF